MSTSKKKNVEKKVSLGNAIIIGAVSNGPVVGAILGLTFGLTSFAQCFGMDAFGTTLMQISPVNPFVRRLPGLQYSGNLRHPFPGGRNNRRP